MLNRTIVINPIEPALLSVRAPLGVALDLGLTFQRQDGSPVDPNTLIPQIALMPRSTYGVFAYDIETTSSEGGKGNVTVPGNALMDAAGYTIEIYQRRPADYEPNPPVPTGLLAKGVLRLEGSAYQQYGPLEILNVPIIVGPQGPVGPEGPQGQRGAMWFTGNGPPATTVGTEDKINGDMYLDNGIPPTLEGAGDIWRFDGAAWVLGVF